MIAKEICKDCKYWVRGETHEAYGDCHKDPPVYLQKIMLWGWPNVAEDNYCGYWTNSKITMEDV